MELAALDKQISAFLQEAGAQKPFIALIGPTASGKTALSIQIAQKFHCEIISADSRQVYRHMDIGTDKIQPVERAGIPHHLIDVVNPDERFTVVDFKQRAEKLIEEIIARKKIPLVVGGTGLYVTALAENFQIPETGDDHEFRKKMEAELAQRGKEWLHNELAKVDPETAAKIPAESHLYVLRALEIHHATGRPKINQKGPKKYTVLKIGLKPQRKILFQRIQRRIELQYEKGILDEIKKLLAMGYSPELPALRSFGYRENIAHLQGKITLAQAKELILKNTKNFARRQITWWKRDPEVIWLENL